MDTKEGKGGQEELRDWHWHMYTIGAQSLSVRLSVTPWIVARQAPLSMGLSRQEYWSGWPCPPPDHLPNPGIELTSPALQVDSLPLSHQRGPNTLWKVKVKVKSLSHAWLSATPWAAAHQAPLSMGFSRQEYWHGLPFPSPGDLPDPGIKPRSPALQADSLPTELTGKPTYTILDS